MKHLLLSSLMLLGLASAGGAAAPMPTPLTATAAIRDAALKKGDAIATARIAGIMAAKRTPELVPLCHPLPLSRVVVDLAPQRDRVVVQATVRTRGVTGVEMEALTAVAVTGLTLHDMVKAVDRRAQMDGIRLLSKTGGKSGDWHRDDST